MHNCRKMNNKKKFLNLYSPLQLGAYTKCREFAQCIHICILALISQNLMLLGWSLYIDSCDFGAGSMIQKSQ